MAEAIYSINNNNEVLMSDCATHEHQWTPAALEESCNGVNEVQLMTKHFSNRKIFLIGNVTDNMAITFVSQFLYLSHSNDPIDLYINSPGGSVDAGLVIYDVIQACKDKIPINMYCVGMAASMGAVILAGGQIGRRYILPNSRTMIHEPLLAGNNFGGSATSIKKASESILETKAIINSILAKHTGKTIKEIDKATSFDNFLNADESVAFGICDAVKNII